MPSAQLSPAKGVLTGARTGAASCVPNVTRCGAFGPAYVAHCSLLVFFPGLMCCVSFAASMRKLQEQNEAHQASRAKWAEGMALALEKKEQVMEPSALAVSNLRVPGRGPVSFSHSSFSNH